MPPRSTRKTAAPKRSRTRGKAVLLEQSVEALKMLNFSIFDSSKQFRGVQIVPPRYVIRGYRHETETRTIYKTPGIKEALIVVRGGDSTFIPDANGDTRALVEAKWQEGSGSVDEKFPFVYWSFLESTIPNWIVIVDGRYWRGKRGTAAKQWFEDLAPGPEGRRLVVVNRIGFVDLATRIWGNSA